MRRDRRLLWSFLSAVSCGVEHTRKTEEKCVRSEEKSWL